ELETKCGRVQRTNIGHHTAPGRAVRLPFTAPGPQYPATPIHFYGEYRVISEDTPSPPPSPPSAPPSRFRRTLLRVMSVQLAALLLLWLLQARYAR
ncbi:MAG: hypothetical protein ACT4R6_04835, partial [Gemmatimonadaceae bacterium]